MGFELCNGTFLRFLKNKMNLVQTVQCFGI